MLKSIYIEIVKKLNSSYTLHYTLSDIYPNSVTTLAPLDVYQQGPDSILFMLPGVVPQVRVIVPARDARRVCVDCSDAVGETLCQHQVRLG